MTHPLTPREKVRKIIDGALNSAIPETWEVANHATDAILTALASGSGDHVELARLKAHIANLKLRPGHHVQFGTPSVSQISNYWNRDLAADLDYLLAENAALRAANTEAERKLADERLNYEGAMSDIDSLLKVLIRRINGEADLASAAEWVRLNYPIAAEAIVSKEAERG